MRLASVDDAIFRPDGGRLAPTEFAQGPWNPEHQHGGAVCALLARAVERCEMPVPMRPARISFDLMRPVPMRPVQAAARVTKSGRRVQAVDAALLEGEIEVARARALLIRRHPELPIDAELRADPGSTRPPERISDGIRYEPSRFAAVPGYARAVDFDRRPFGARAGEHGVAWTRLRCPVVAGEETSPLVRLAALADFASGLGNPLDFARYVSINPDLTLHVLREPVGEWIALDCVTELGDDCIGQSLAAAHDREGPIARIQTSLLLDRR